jgi:hypothetical protein
MPSVVAQGGRFAGWALYLDDGRPTYCHNWFESDRYYVRAPEALGSGEHTILYQFDLDGGQPGAGGSGTLLIDGEVVAEGRIDKTVPFIFSADETMDIGQDLASPVTDDYPGGDANVFSGTIKWVQVDLQDEDTSQVEDPEATYHPIHARQ